VSSTDNQEVMTLQVKERLRLSRRFRVASSGAIATLALLGSGLAASAPANAVEAPQAVPMVKQSVMVKERPTARRDCFIPRCYGAIALANRDAAVGGVYNYASKFRALRAAKRQCRIHSNFPRSCRARGWVRNGCVALAIKRRADGSVARWGRGVAYTKRRAYRQALNYCARPRCVKWAHVCTSRR
jgi:hypothetical protein